jgi:hypothetical protein
MRRAALALTFALAACSGVPHRTEVARPVEPPDCRAWIGYDRDAEHPGYWVDSAAGAKVCVPLLVTGIAQPAGYRGDFRVDEFTDAKLKERWAACKADKVCNDRVQPTLKRWLPPNTARSPRSTGAVDPVGKIDPSSNDVNLADIRRPAFFAKAPYAEPIAEAEKRTYTVEFAVPRDTFEIVKLGMKDDIRLRGWYLEGAGVPDAAGRRIRALVVMSNGGGGQLTAIQHPADVSYTFDAAKRKTTGNRFPNKTTEQMGQRLWRQMVHEMNRAGFDVLSYDRRGEGISGGTSDTNTLEQGEDIFRALEQIGSGRGLRILTPEGQVLTGDAAATKLEGRRIREVPILLMGYSRGSMATGWAMHANFNEYCSYDRAEVACRPGRGWNNVKGAILLASFSSGAGYLPASPDLEDRNLFLGAMAADHNMAFYPNSAQLKGMHRWPAAFFGKGLWDRAESVEGTIAAYDRIRGPREIVVLRGPHTLEAHAPENQRYLIERMVAFAKGVATGAKVEGQKEWRTIRELVATSPDVWEKSSEPIR